MKSNFERIGSHIRLVDNRNTDRATTRLLGLSIDKKFIPSVANTIGTDLANYKVIRKGQFACSLMQVRRDKKMPVALLFELEEAIISPAYIVFEVIDKARLIPEYLMMWMVRPEFDREACFYAVGGVRGSLEWDDFCNMKLPMPPPEKQRSIVAEYRAVVDRIHLNERNIEKLEETAQAIYNHWFVDFEFPINAREAREMGKPELEGKPYQTSGGALTYNDVLNKEIPVGWEVIPIGSSFRLRYGKNLPTNLLQESGFDVFGGNGIIGKFKRYTYSNKQVALACRGAASGKVNITTPNSFVTNNSIVVENSNEIVFPYLKHFCLSYKFEDHVTGSAQPQLTIDGLDDAMYVKPPLTLIEDFNNRTSTINSRSDTFSRERRSLETFRSVLLASLAKKESE